MTIANRGPVFQQLDRLFREGSLVGLGDSQLLERYLTRRDPAAFETLLNIHGPMVLALCRRILRDPCDVEDAFQATFLVLVRKAPAIRDRTLLSNWLYGVAFRVATRARSNTLRRRNREMTGSNLEPAVDADAPDSSGLGPALDQELSRLPGKFRAPLVLCYLRGQTHDQAAEELQCPVGTVRSRLARGRDLLKRRLTRRGFAPTAALLGTGSSLPVRLLTEAVPPPLVGATVEAALASSTFTTIQAGAVSASVLALTQGVLTSMKLAPLKWIGLAALTTGLSVGGVVAISHARPQSARAGGDPGHPVIRAAVPQEATSPQRGANVRAAPISESTDDAEKEIERKIDQLLKDIGFFGSDGSDGSPASDGSLADKVLRRRLGELLNPPSTTTSSVGGTSGTSASTTRTSASATPASGATTSTSAIASSAAASGAPGQASFEPRLTVDAARQSVPALGVELKLALDDFDRVERLYKASSVSLQQREAVRGKVLLTAAILDGQYDELVEQNERLKLEFKKKRAELEQAEAQRDVAASVLAFNQVSNVRRSGTIDESNVPRAKGELKAAEASVAVKQVELEQLELRRDQMSRQAQRIKQVLALADRFRAAAPAAQPAPADVPGR
jgi:RNA polymerase sigma factor (sigma-70 family)